MQRAKWGSAAEFDPKWFERNYWGKIRPKMAVSLWTRDTKRSRRRFAGIFSMRSVGTGQFRSDCAVLIFSTAPIHGNQRAKNTKGRAEQPHKVSQRAIRVRVQKTMTPLLNESPLMSFKMAPAGVIDRQTTSSIRGVASKRSSVRSSRSAASKVVESKRNCKAIAKNPQRCCRSWCCPCCWRPAASSATASKATGTPTFRNRRL